MKKSSKIINSIFNNHGVGSHNESDRLEWLENVLLQLPIGSRILDAGAGELDQKKFCSHLDYVSQDFAQYNGSGDNKGIQTGSWDNTKLDIISDIINIPEPESSFDAIMCIEVFEHLPNPIEAIKEFSRLLKNGGRLIITAPFCSLTHFAPYHFYSGFNRYFYETHLKANNFSIIDITANGNYFEFMAQELRRLEYCTSTYTDMSINTVDKLAIKQLLKSLSELSAKESNSSELLNFGYQIVARATK